MAIQLTRFKKESVRVEMTQDTLARLLSTGQVCAAELHCLDCRSKQCLWRLCLKSCTITSKGGRKNGSHCQQVCGACGLQINTTLPGT